MSKLYFVLYKKKVLFSEIESIYYLKWSFKNYYENLPSGWNITDLQTIASISLGKTPEKNNLSYWTNGSIPFVSISDINSDNLILTKQKISKKALEDVFKSKIIEKGTLLMSFKLSIGKTTILGIDAVHNEAIVNLIPFYDKNHIIRNYLKVFLPVFIQNIETTKAIKGNTLNKEKLMNLKLPLPPLFEQQKIIVKVISIIRCLSY